MDYEPVTIIQSDIDAYARVSGDFNPIHVDPEFAKTTPYGSTIAHGTISSAVIVRRLLHEIGPNRVVKRLSLRFIAPIRSGDSLWAHVELLPESTAHLDQGGQAYKVSTSNQANETIAIGEAVVAMAQP